jgi:hypothetical protein
MEDIMVIEDMKCCGNCKNRNRQYYGTHYLEQCGKDNQPCGSGSYCENWQFDNLQKKERKL